MSMKCVKKCQYMCYLYHNLPDIGDIPRNAGIVESPDMAGISGNAGMAVSPGKADIPAVSDDISVPSSMLFFLKAELDEDEDEEEKEAVEGKEKMLFHRGLLKVLSFQFHKRRHTANKMKKCSKK